MLKAILWDMDGTLVDSEPLWGIATYEMSEKIGRRLTPELREQTVGGTFANTIGICEAHAGVELTDEQRKEMYDWCHERVGVLFDGFLTLNLGVEPLLAEINKLGIPMMVVTNTPRALADRGINAIGRHRFTDTICGDEVSKGKPDPEIYATAAARLGVDPSDCLVFEDSTTGMTAAHAAGCKVVGFPDNESTRIPEGVRTMEQLGAPSTFVGVTASDLHNWFERLSH